MATTRSETATPTDRFGRIAAVIGGVAFGPFALWAMVAPQSFFDQLATFEPYNQHFIQDIGALQLGLATVLLLAAARPARGALTVPLVGAGVGASAHVISHVIGRDLGGNPATDIPLFTVVAVVLLAAGVQSWRREE